MRDLLFVGLFALFLTNTHAADINDLTYDATGDTVIITDCAEDASGDLVIPENIEGKPVTSIGSRAFFYCSDLTSITIPQSVTTIGSSAFYKCTSLTSITIPDGVTSIERSTFGGCTRLTSVTIPNSVTSIGISAFHDCNSLTDIDIPNSVTSIGENAFRSCRFLNSITIPDSVINIECLAFGGCHNLYWINMGRSVATIGSHAFDNCRSLTSITIPENVTRIGYNTFRSCTKLKSITFESNNPPKIVTGSLGEIKNKILYVPKDATGYHDWDNSEGYVIKSVNTEFEYVDCSIIKLKDNENIRLSFSGESEKEYFIQRSCDLEHWEILEGNIQPVLKSKLIFDEQQQKKALVPTEDIGNDWIQLNYDDSNWLEVESVSADGTLVGGGVGFARSGTRVDPFDPYIALDLEEQMYGVNASVYMRIPFTVEELSEIGSLTLSVRTDDGFIAWINGDKVQSFNAPDKPQWDSGATVSNPDSIAQNLKEFPLDDYIEKLKVGENIIAIQALNKGKSGSDFLFSCNLLVKRIIKSVRDYSIDYPLISSWKQTQARSQFYRVISQ